MSYAAVHTFTVGEVATAANLNNLGGDITALLSIGANVATSETTTSTTYANLTTVGPSVTMNTGDRTEVEITLSARLSNSGASGDSFMSVDVSGATTLAAVDDNALFFKSPSAGNPGHYSRSVKITGLTAGSNTFTAKYRTTANTSTFQFRWLIVGL